jgi:hypothetical protein
MLWRVRLPNNEVFKLQNVQNMTVNDVIECISKEKGIPKESIACYHDNQLLLPFVKVNAFDGIDAHYSSFGCRSTVNEPWIWKQRSSPATAPGMQARRTCIRAIECSVNRTRLQMVVDTGASHSILYTSQVNECKLGGGIDTNPADLVNFTIVQGTTVKSLGIMRNVPLIIGGISTSHHFVVLDGVSPHGLLGIDWLQENGVLIDIGADCLRIGAEVIPFVDVRGACEQ